MDSLANINIISSALVATRRFTIIETDSITAHTLYAPDGNYALNLSTFEYGENKIIFHSFKDQVEAAIADLVKTNELINGFTTHPEGWYWPNYSQTALLSLSDRRPDGFGK